MTLQTAVQSDPFVLREGLPYWIFWLLLCLILLLLAFIFLRDKELRQRLSLALAGAKRRMKRAQLGLRLKREKKRKVGLQGQLGRLVWTGRLEPGLFAPAFGKLTVLEAKEGEVRGILESALAEVTAAGQREEEARLRRKELLRSRDSGGEVEPHALRLLKEEQRSFGNKVREHGKIVAVHRDELRLIREKEESLLEELGAKADGARLEHESLLPLYAQIDKVNRAILGYMDKIEKLT